MSGRPEKVRMALVDGDRGGKARAVDDELLTARDVGEMFGLTAGTILDWWQEGKLPGFRLGGSQRCVRFRRSEILRVLETWRDGPPPAPGDSQLRVVE